MSSFLLALQFLTTLPLKIKKFNPAMAAWAAAYFPVVGLFLGLILAGLNRLLSVLGFVPLASNIILVVTLIALTGGIHLDGLSDTADAFLSGKKREEMLEIMRDPHIGAMGALSLISIILLKIGLLSSLSAMAKPAVLILMCILSRWGAVCQIYLFPYARQDGKAKLFFQGMNLKIFMAAAVITILCVSLVLRAEGLIVLLMITCFAYIAGMFVRGKIGGLTGDTLGAVIELTEVITLIIVCVGQGVFNG